MKPQCCICGSVVPAQFWACGRCRQSHELSNHFEQWPAWAKALKANEQERRRYEEEWRDRMHSASVLAEEGMHGVPNDGLGAFTGLFARPEQVDGLAYAPYGTEEENRAYRRANGIPER